MTVCISDFMCVLDVYENVYASEKVCVYLFLLVPMEFLLSEGVRRKYYSNINPMEDFAVINFAFTCF